MNFRELKELIAEGESSTLEFKRKFTSFGKIAKEITSFANSKGGILLLGVDDDGTIVGVRSEKSAVDSIVHVCDFFIEPPINPDIEIISIRGKDVIAAYIDEGERKPYQVPVDPDDPKSERLTYIRVGEQSVHASSEMTRILKGLNSESNPLSLIVGDIEKRLFDYLEHKERATVKDFQNLCNISKRRAERLLVRLVRAGVIHIHNDSSSDYFTLR
jgi:predicted HTH transcriptional regulator